MIALPPPEPDKPGGTGEVYLRPNQEQRVIASILNKKRRRAFKSTAENRQEMLDITLRNARAFDARVSGKAISNFIAMEKLNLELEKLATPREVNHNHAHAVIAVEARADSLIDRLRRAVEATGSIDAGAANGTGITGGHGTNGSTNGPGSLSEPTEN